MASLKQLRSRIGSIKSTRKITNAMKMVAAAKLRRTQARAEAAKPYAEAMQRMLREVAQSPEAGASPHILLSGTGRSDRHLLIPLTSDRGLCGPFNANVISKTEKEIEKLREAGKEVMLFPVGRRAVQHFMKCEESYIVGHLEDILENGNVPFSEANKLGEKVVSMLERKDIDVCAVVFNRFENAMKQTPTLQQIAPLNISEKEEKDSSPKEEAAEQQKISYLFEPGEDELLSRMLPRNLQVQIYTTFLETVAGENGARMAAMDNATRNAGRSIDKLTGIYNRSRQANITNELIEIISGAQAV